VEVTISPEGIVRFVFTNIDLPARSEDEAGSQGFVSFTIQPDSDLTPNQSIYNTTSIYFDFNLPIETNITVWSLTDDLTPVGIEEPSKNISIYPIPTDGYVTIETEMESTYQLWDSTGKWIGTGQLQGGINNTQLDSHPGLYILQVTDGKGRMVVEKIVVM